MATRNITVTGIANWAKVFEENRDMDGFEGTFRDHDGATTINVILDAENYETLKDSKSMLKGKVVEDGIDVKFKRKWTERFEWTGGAPKVFKPDGSSWDFKSDGVIPNGSLVEVSLSVYDTSRERIVGTRLESVKVLKAAEMPDRTGDNTPAKDTTDGEEEIPFV